MTLKLEIRSVKLPDKKTWYRDYLILCEGNDDQSFFQKLLSSRGLENQFQVKFPDKNSNGTGGRSKFGSYLQSLELDRVFLSTVKAIVIVSDNDNNPNASFNEVADSLRKTNSLPIPSSERIWVKNSKWPPISVLMLPKNSAGNLESLCLSAALSKWPIGDSLQAFMDSTEARNWDFGKQAKAKIHSLLAVTCEPKPETSFAYHWQEDENYHIPLTHECFDDVANFLSNVETTYLTAINV